MAVGADQVSDAVQAVGDKALRVLLGVKDGEVRRYETGGLVERLSARVIKYQTMSEQHNYSVLVSETDEQADGGGPAEAGLAMHSAVARRGYVAEQEAPKRVNLAA